jgi:hypothetical protein
MFGQRDKRSWKFIKCFLRPLCTSGSLIAYIRESVIVLNIKSVWMITANNSGCFVLNDNTYIQMKGKLHATNFTVMINAVRVALQSVLDLALLVKYRRWIFQMIKTYKVRIDVKPSDVTCQISRFALNVVM